MPSASEPINRVMLDLETYGTKPGAIVVSIGAVRIIGREVTDDHFWVNIDPADSARHGLVRDLDTMAWWLEQSPHALSLMTTNRWCLMDALGLFAEWLGDATELWGNGSDFDNAILAEAYRAAGQRVPWEHWANRCYRTVKSCCPEIKYQHEGVKHFALDDARSEADHLVRCLASLSIQ